MNFKQIYFLVVTIFVVFFMTIFTSGANAQGTCPTSGTHGKDVNRDFFVDVVGQLKDVLQNDFAVEALMAWKPYENTNAYWNPLATTWKAKPICNFNSVGVQNYIDRATGVQATANTLNLGYYDSIRKMFRLEAFEREAIRSNLGTWGTCSGAGCNSLLDTWQTLYNSHKNTPTPFQTNNTSTVMVFDTSSSMESPDPSGVIKLDAAKFAGDKILDILDAENRAGTTFEHRVAIVNFNSNVWVDQYPTTNITDARSALNNLYATGVTGMASGLEAALGVIENESGIYKPVIILLSDGLPNLGLKGEDDQTIVYQQIFDLADQAGQRGICIYTVGFGDPQQGDLDENLLSQIASASGCGKYYNAADAWQLANVYISVHHSSTGQTLLEKTGQISQGETVDIGSVQVPDYQQTLLFTLNWPGSLLKPKLKDPNGVEIDQNYPGVSITTTSSLATILVQNPPAGLWQVLAMGVDVPEGITIYNAVLSIRENPNPPTVEPPLPPEPTATPSFGGTILIIVLAAGIVMVVVIRQTGARSQSVMNTITVQTQARLVIIRGTNVGRAISMSDGMVIGRSPFSKLRLTEQFVSRQHARLRYANGRWYVQDMGSSAGTYVNGQRVQAVVLNSGDRIRIGNTEFEFRSY